ncbi:hypothetical protein [Paraburkholderia nemoris]|uniref:hypothetical protein n=1 Tax=Paraburkholderia nemoris TaxID=2793076 RepID=UPI00190AF9CE|nr:MULTISPECIES: hypothetical protein [Paraburkholderia]MBK3813073.1 hypothetical protein [Paraburkholderia aspalathi]MBK5149473.1 hypothetical protein [Burkholderia sp. R-69608]
MTDQANKSPLKNLGTSPLAALQLFLFNTPPYERDFHNLTKATGRSFSSLA